MTPCTDKHTMSWKKEADIHDQLEGPEGERRHFAVKYALPPHGDQYRRRMFTSESHRLCIALLTEHVRCRTRLVRRLHVIRRAGEPVSAHGVWGMILNSHSAT